MVQITIIIIDILENNLYYVPNTRPFIFTYLILGILLSPLYRSGSWSIGGCTVRKWQAQEFKLMQYGFGKVILNCHAIQSL